MGRFSKKIKRNNDKQHLSNIQGDNLNQKAQMVEDYLQETINQRVKDALKIMVDNITNVLSNALEDVFREEYGFGDKRIQRLLFQLNERMSTDVKFKEEKIELKEKNYKKINKEKLYDLTELLLELNCSEFCNKKKYQECNLYKSFKSRNIPMFDSNSDGCPYKVKENDKITKKDIKRRELIIQKRFDKLID